MQLSRLPSTLSHPAIFICYKHLSSEEAQVSSEPASSFLAVRSLGCDAPYLASPPGRRERSGQAHLCEALLQAEAEAVPKPRAKLEPENLRALSMALLVLPGSAYPLVSTEAGPAAT